MSRPLSGLRAWLVQRISAVYLAVFIIYLLWHFSVSPPASHAEWLAWFNRPLVAAAWGVFFACLLLHAWVGVRDIILDYVKPLLPRITLLGLTALGLSACAVWALRILLGGPA